MSTAFLAVLWHCTTLCCCFNRVYLRSYDEMSAYIARCPRPFWQALAGFTAIGSCSTAGWFVSLSLHKPMAVQLHCVIEKVFSPRIKKRVFTISIYRCSTSSRISGNRVYVKQKTFSYDGKAEFSASSLNCSVSHDASEIILICRWAAQ